MLLLYNTTLSEGRVCTPGLAEVSKAAYLIEMDLLVLRVEGALLRLHELLSASDCGRRNSLLIKSSDSFV